MNKLRSSKSQVCLPRQDAKKTKKVKMNRTPSLQATQQMHHQQLSFGQSSQINLSNVHTARQTLVRKPNLPLKNVEPIFLDDSKLTTLKLIKKCQPNLQQYDKYIESSGALSAKTCQLQAKQRQIQERCQMLREDMCSRQVEKAYALIVVQECERVMQLHRQQYAQQSQLLEKQKQIINRVMELNKMQGEVGRQLTQSDQSWNRFNANSNYNRKNHSFEFKLKKSRLALFQLQIECSRIAHQTKFRTLRNVICQFTNQKQKQLPYQKQNGFQIWLCSNQLLQQFCKCLEGYRKEVHSQLLVQSLGRYKEALLSFGQIFRQGKQHYVIKKTHLSQYSNLTAEAHRIATQLKILDREQKQLNQEMELVFARQKQSHLLQLDLQHTDTRQLNSIIRKIDKEQRLRIRKILEVDKKMNEASRIVCRQKQGETAHLLQVLKEQSLKLIKIAKQIRLVKSQQLKNDQDLRTIYSKINAEVSQQRRKQERVQVRMIRDLCEIVESTRVQMRHSVKYSTKNKQPLKMISEMGEVEAISGAITNRQLLKSARFFEQSKGSSRSSFESLSNRMTLRRFA